MITTPYSFVATAHSLLWNGIKPVFVDVEPDRYNVDSDRIAEAITEKTQAILCVHVAESEQRIELVRGEDVRDRVGVTDDLDRCGDTRHGHGSTGLRQRSA